MKTAVKGTFSLRLCCMAALVSITPAVAAVAAVGLVAGQAAGQASALGERQVPALFFSHDLIEFTIETDYGRLRGDRTQDSEYRPAIMRMTDDEGVARTIEIRVKTRGNFRLTNCRFPPMRVNFPRSRLGGTVFDGQNGIKLVSHCRDRDDDEQNILEEYLVYRTFNLLTDVSFRVRLARVTYADGADDDDPVIRYAFFIEEAEAMAERLGMLYFEVERTGARSFGAEGAVRFSVFQYMVGNTDWAMTGFHNTVFVQNAERVYIPIPYDFDQTGFVSTRYATPYPGLGIRNVRQRIYRGFCRDNFDFSKIYAQFVEIRRDLEVLYTNQEGLEEGNRRDAVEFIDDFYEDIESPQRARNRLEEDCREMS